MRKQYTGEVVEGFLRNYLYLRSYLNGSVLVGNAERDEEPNPYVRIKSPSKREQPLGWDGNDWPFMVGARAKAPMDGKAKANRITEMIVSLCDIECALNSLDAYERALVVSRLILDESEDKAAKRCSRASGFGLEAEASRITYKMARLLNNGEIRE